MNVTETGQILAKICLIENRSATNETILAWQEILADVLFEDALEAVKRYYRTNHFPIKPAHVFMGSREVKEERKKRIIT